MTVRSTYLAITLWAENRPFLPGGRPGFADISLLPLTVSSRYGLRKAPRLSKKMTLFSSQSDRRTCT
ncbi:MAG: hypothetical protein KTR30_37645 [Saprospiraceae bacterium]|nr:hypothetical protein [Saprospiraceae bacterium]